MKLTFQLPAFFYESNINAPEKRFVESLGKRS
jgi:hypothetical protein